ncbi:MAG: LPP20 family lipoprotein [Pontibacterium sp.]
MTVAIRIIVLSMVVLLAGCETALKTLQDIDAIYFQDEEHLEELVIAEPNWVRATGYAPISLQSGMTREHKVIKAMRASKLRAYQELTAIVHGQYLFGTTTVNDMVVANDDFKTAVSGIVRGARVVKSYPVQDDTYATILEVDINQVQRAWIVGESTELQ